LPSSRLAFCCQRRLSRHVGLAAAAATTPRHDPMLGIRTLLSSTNGTGATRKQQQCSMTNKRDGYAAAVLFAIAGLVGWGSTVATAWNQDATATTASNDDISTEQMTTHGINVTDRKAADFNHPPPRPDLPTYTMEEVSEHADEESLWYTFRGGVYDMTFFLNGHPGGAPRLLMAAGQDLGRLYELVGL
jgi:Cytochrome b5-like Heme/Steroid binding domain